MELFEGNAFYGHASILKRYAGIDEDRPFPATIQHGLLGTRDEPIEHDLKSPLPRFWLWSERQAEKFQSVGQKKIFIGGAPFLYLLEDLSFSAKRDKGTIAFPHHGTPHLEIVGGYEAYAEALSQLPRAFHPISVCLHHSDLEKGLDQPFRKQGMDVRCNGPMMEPDFLNQFVKHCEGFRYATSNIFATAAYYTMALGLRFFLHGPKVAMINRSDPNIPLGPRKQAAGFPEMEEAFQIECVEEKAFQRFFAEIELGKRHQLPRAFLHQRFCDWMSEPSYQQLTKERLTLAQKGML